MSTGLTGDACFLPLLVGKSPSSLDLQWRNSSQACMVKHTADFNSVAIMQVRTRPLQPCRQRCRDILERLGSYVILCRRSEKPTLVLQVTPWVLVQHRQAPKQPVERLENPACGSNSTLSIGLSRRSQPPEARQYIVRRSLTSLTD